MEHEEEEQEEHKDNVLNMMTCFLKENLIQHQFKGGGIGCTAHLESTRNKDNNLERKHYSQSENKCVTSTGTFSEISPMSQSILCS